MTNMNKLVMKIGDSLLESNLMALKVNGYALLNDHHFYKVDNFQFEYMNTKPF